jgi:hypothetical protein
LKIYLNAGFGDLLGAGTLNWIQSHGFCGIRQEIMRGEHAEPRIREIADSGLEAILLVCGGHMEKIAFHHTVELARHVTLVARDVVGIDIDRLAIEIGNEPDLATDQYKENPAQFAALVREAASAIWREVPTMKVISGGVSNTHKKGLDYLAAAANSGFPQGCHIGYHAYHTTVTPETPHEGFRTRNDEFSRLRTIVAGRPMWCTEVGWHTYPSQIREGLLQRQRTVHFDDDQVADFTERELRLHQAAGAVCAAIFQLNDAEPASSHEHRYGVRRLDNTPKPVALRIQQIAPGLTS